MYGNNLRGWFRRHNGEVFRPWLIVDILGREHDHPLQEYAKLDRAGLMIPLSYEDGLITSVKLNFPTNVPLYEIEYVFRLPKGTLSGVLEMLHTSQPRNVSEFKLSHRVLQVMVDNHYIYVDSDERVSLAREGHKFAGRFR